jgi:hypothetical protein
LSIDYTLDSSSVMLSAPRFGAPGHTHAATYVHKLGKLNTKGFYTEMGDSEVKIGDSKSVRKMAISWRD